MRFIIHNAHYTPLQENLLIKTEPITWEKHDGEFETTYMQVVYINTIEELHHLYLLAGECGLYIDFDSDYGLPSIVIRDDWIE